MKCPGDLKDINALVNYMQSACPGDLKDMNVIRHYIWKNVLEIARTKMFYVIIS